MTRILLHLLYAACFAAIAGCTSAARFVERTPSGGIVAVPDYDHRGDALALIHHEVGSNAIIVDEAEVVTGTDVKTVAESGDGSIFTRIGAWFTGTKQVASTETQTLKSTEWRINYAVPTQPRPSNP